MRTRLICCALAAACLTVAACEKKDPPAPSSGGNQGESVTGRERIGWDQQASGTGELATLRYAIYVDGTRSEIAEVSCAVTAGAAGFACSGRLPSMSPGAHTVEMATFVTNGAESARSAPLRLTVTGATSGDGLAVPWTSRDAGTTVDGVRLHIERIGDGIVDPVDAAASPDGRLFIAERGGRIMSVDDGRLRPTPALVLDEVQEGGGLLALTLDAHFTRTRFVYVLYAAPSRQGLTYRLARFREVAGIFGERAILINSIAPAGDSPSGIVRFATDGRLLLALGRTDETTPSSYDGKVLRFERDGSTPQEQPGAPIVLGGIEAPGGLAWDARRSLAWVLDRRSDSGVLNGLALAAGEVARVQHAYRLKDRDAASLAVHDGTLLPALAGNLLVASDSGRHILRLQIDPESRRIQGEPLLQDMVGGIRVVTVAPDGAIYFCTADAVGVIR